ncbi:type I-E CRISPR-associated protein Cas6/Cse3/CasE [Janthinobacterium agaricidamnosum]|uniref:CRISPR associated family protein n=1 Tax=Janthinobacterium agaricidamnosum NBRC 102515 = DSM 9628 TaxID=1349767 RepID=W0V8W9_9BURK|nr:type I-E CRISPR-associated protein Cas6/Cse3/CasE [Janthinobacterium agaricidamnosum]CDG83798.1 CRISPR associated family protein [Janthinobacterium agaricidamnosum NBRC 102515 = DSM 9628]
MYFSVITPQEDLLRQAGHELAQQPYTEHQWLWQFFPSAKDQARDFIFRRHQVESTRSHEPLLIPRFYVVSARPPVAFSDAWLVDSRSYDPKLQSGQKLSFELRANPVVSKKNAAGKSRRHDVVIDAKKRLLLEKGFSPDAKWRDWKDSEDKPGLYALARETCLEWLNRRAPDSGFKVLAADVDSYRQQKEKKKGADKPIEFSTVDFSGELEVTDVALFLQTLRQGLGHAKAFGCGLLLVKRSVLD